MNPREVCRWAGKIVVPLFLPALPVWAAPITVANFSFENQATNLNAGQWTNQLIDWVGTNGSNNPNAFMERINGFVAVGTDHLGMELNYDVWQDPGLIYQAASVYTLTVATGNRTGTTASGNQSTYALADNTGAVFATAFKDASTQPGNSFQDATALVLDTAAMPAAVGKPIRILLRARGAGRSHFDNVRFDGPADARATLTTSAATAITPTTAQLNGMVTAIGAGAPTITFYYGPSDGGTSPAGWPSNVVLPGTHTGAFSAGLTNLSSNVQYFFRAKANNTAGDRWSTPAGSFTTQPPPPAPPVVENLAAGSVRSTSAMLGAFVSSTGGQVPTVTVYYGTADGGTVAGNWPASIVLGAVNASASKLVEGLAENTTYFHRAFASNAIGNDWAPTSGSFVTPDASLPTVINLAPESVVHRSATVRGSVTSIGGDPPQATIYWGTTDGGTTAGTWQNAAPQGYQANDFSEDLIGLAPGTTYYFRSAATNPAGTGWATATGSFTTPGVSAPVVANEPAGGITPTTASLRGLITDDGGSPVSITVYWGTTDGGANPAAWQHAAPVGVRSDDFARFVGGLNPNTTYRFRSFASNATGSAWASTSESFTTAGVSPSKVIINEIHYRRPNNNPARKGQSDEFLPETKAIEFIELHNPTAAAVDISGWRINDGVEFVFPAVTSLPEGGYICVAQNPTHFQERFLRTAFGPWTGTLATNGERIRVVDASGGLADEVDYEAGFPWPTAARGGGESAERVHPLLDPDLGGSWRASGPVTQPPFIALSSTNWHWRKGTNEPSATVGAWRLEGFVEDGTWQVGGSAFGFGVTAPPATVTVLPDMRQITTPPNAGYTCIYLRHNFQLTSIPAQLYISAPIDDGAVFWINGSEVARSNVAPALVNPAYTDTASTSGSPTVPRTFTLNNPAAYVHTGTNVIAVQAFNVLINNADFFFDMELRIPPPQAGLGSPSPGAPNANSSTLAPPAVREVNHTPQQPAAGQDVTITAKVSDPDGVSDVSLKYQAVNPGSYISRKNVVSVSGGNTTYSDNPAYENPANWVTLAMHDDGVNGDAIAGDAIYSVIVPGAVQTHRRLVRYRVFATDSAASPSTVQTPYPDDEQPNFAYFCYNGVPGWTGAFRPTAFATFPATPAQSFPAQLLNSIEPYHLIATATDVTNCQYQSAYDDGRFFGTLVYEGIVYDHINFKNRGIASTYVSGKNKWAVHFNRARDFQARDNWGRPYQETWNSLILDANACPWASVHRGAAGVEEAVSYRIFELGGVPALRTHYVHWRVIDNAVETSATSQYDSDLWGLYLSLEPMEGNFADEHGIEDGNMYNIQGNAEKLNQSETQVANGSDWTQFSSGLMQANQTEAWYRDNEDLGNLFTFLGLGRLIGNVDVRPDNNYRYYHRPGDNRWLIMPYDLDMQFIAATHWGGGMDNGITVAGAPNSIRSISRHPAIALEFRNRCRELISLMASDNSPSGGQIGQLIDEYAQFVNPSGQAQTWADIDAAMWNLHPRSAGGGGPTGQSSHRGNFWRATYNDGTRGGLGGTIQTGTWVRNLPDSDGDSFSDHEGMMQWFVNFSTNTYPPSAPLWVRKATSASGGGTDSSPDRQKGYGYKYLEWESRYGGYVNANANPTTPPDLAYPNKPVITYIGGPGFPASDLTFQSSAFSPSSSGGTTFAAMQWRLGEISAPGVPFYDPGEPRKYELESLWDSGELTAFNNSVRMPASAVRTGHTYRARVRHKDANGRWSFWSDPVQFISGEANVAVYLQSLVVTELNYHPLDASTAEITAGFSTEDFEFIEVKNVSGLPVSLADIRLTKGVDFDFPAQLMLPPGGFVLVVKNLAAFQMRYGHAHDSIIAGSFAPDSLANGGEEVKLSYGQGEPIREFAYGDAPPWPDAADGTGPTLTLINPASLPDHTIPTNWKASGVSLGTPGADDSSGGMTYGLWAAGYPGVSDPDADNDFDGVSNWLEYAFNGDPLAPSTDILPDGGIQSINVGGNLDDYLVVLVSRRAGTSDLEFIVEFSTDLVSWSGGAVLVSSTPNPDGSITDIYRSPAPISTQESWFAHVVVN